jgi:hypothetical protein
MQPELDVEPRTDIETKNWTLKPRTGHRNQELATETKNWPLKQWQLTTNF